MSEEERVLFITPDVLNAELIKRAFEYRKAAHAFDVKKIAEFQCENPEIAEWLIHFLAKQPEQIFCAGMLFGYGLALAVLEANGMEIEMKLVRKDNANA